MLSTEPRCRYGKSPLGEVICQLRFPEILSISARLPVEFQEELRGEYPGYSCSNDAPPPKLVGGNGNFSVQNTPPTPNYQFSSADGVWRVNLTGRFISLTTSRYQSWEEFAGRLDRPLAAFIKRYQPQYFERIGLRYLNFISREALDLEGVPYRELISPCYLGILGEEDVREADVSRNSMDFELALRGGCRAKVHAGPGMVRRNDQPESKPRFIFDQDLYIPGKLPVNMSAGALQILHTQADALFRGAITNRLHQAMEPEEL